MPTTFKDINGREWKIEWDGLLLDDVRTETGIDLADLSAGGLATIDQDAPKLVKVLSVLLREEIKAASLTDRQFSKLIKRDVQPAAFAAVLGAAADFFPVNVWSDVQQRFETQREFQTNWMRIKPLLAKLNEPSMESLRPTILQALTEMMGGLTSEKLEALASATGQEVTPSSPAIGSLANSASPQAA